MAGEVLLNRVFEEYPGGGVGKESGEGIARRHLAGETEMAPMAPKLGARCQSTRNRIGLRAQNGPNPSALTGVRTASLEAGTPLCRCVANWLQGVVCVETGSGEGRGPTWFASGLLQFI